MKQHIQPTLLGLAISLILTAFSVNAEPPKTMTATVGYVPFYYTDEPRLSAELKRYHRFLPSPAPEELYYHTRLIAAANVDDTPEEEHIALIVVDTKRRADFGNWSQAFLLIANTQSQTRQLEKKAFFKLFDAGTYALEVPAANPIELHPPPFAFTRPTNVFFRLADVTNDGILDVWVESTYGVALLSFENGEFVEVFNRYTVTRQKLAENPEMEIYDYDPSDPEGQKYHRFLAAPPPNGPRYTTRGKFIANIDDTPEKETIVLMTADTELYEWSHAFLLIAGNEVVEVPKKKVLFKLFGEGVHDLEAPWKTIELQNPPFVFRGVGGGGGAFYYGLFFNLVDLTGDGILDIWVEHAYGVAVVSFQEGEFVEVCSVYTSIKREDPIEYIDLDNDGIYEIKIPDRISIEGPTAAYPHWMSLYEWDRNTYVLNNKRFYAHNDEFLTRLLDRYTTWSRYSRNQEYHFYIGLVYFYRDNIPKAREYLQWVLENGKGEGYIHAAEDLLKKLPSH